MKPTTLRPSFITALLGTSLLASSYTHAQSSTWTLNNNGFWNATGNWASGVIANGTDNIATLDNITVNRTITLGVDRTIGGINAADTSNSFIITGNTLTLDVTTGAPTITIGTAARSLNIQSVIAGNDGLTKTGAGTLTLSGVNTFTGAINVSAGDLTIANYAGLDAHSGLITVSGGTNGLNLAQVGTGAGTDSYTQNLSLNGFLRTTGGSTGNTLALTWGGNITLTGTSTFHANGNSAIDVNGQVDLGANTLTFTTDGSLAGNRIDGKITGTGGALTKTSGNALIVTGNNDYTGLTTISGGSLNAQHANALGTTAAGTTVAAGAQLRLQGGVTYAAEALTLTTSTGGTDITLRNISGNNTWTGTITASGGGANHLNRINSDAGLLTLQGDLFSAAAESRFALQGAGDITVTGKITGIAGVVGGSVGAGPTVIRTLSNDTNDYTGTSSVSGGVLAFTSIGNVGATSSSLGAPALAESVIGIGSTTTAATLRYIGTAAGGHTSDRVINLGGTTGGATIEASGTDALVLTSAVTATGLGNKTLTLGGTNTDDNSIGAIVNSTGFTTSVTKSDAGKWIITGTSSYSGNTAVNGGTLVINGNISTSTLTTVASGATLGGGGTTGALTIASGGFVTPGNSPGILTVSGNYIQAGTYTAELDGLTAGTQHDRIDVTGTVDITGGSLSTLFTTFTPVNGDLIFILLNDLTDAITGTYAGLAQGAVVTTYGGFDWKISYVANSGTNSFTGGNDIALMAVPEPNAAALLGSFGVLALLRRRR